MGSRAAVDIPLTSPVEGLIDTHVHIWDVTDPGTEWLSGQSELPVRVDTADLIQSMSAELRGLVLVESASSAATTQKLVDAAHVLPWPTRVVGWIDLAQPGVSDRLTALLALDVNGILAGIRTTLNADSDPDRLDEALAALSEHRLVAEVLLGRRQLPLLVDLARRHATVPIVVDHLAALADTGDDTAPWLEAIDALAALPNAVVKISGWQAIAPIRVRRAAAQLTERIGAERLMFGSDWPMSARFGSHAETVAATRALLAGVLPDTQLNEVFGRTARRVYGLPISADDSTEGER